MTLALVIKDMFRLANGSTVFSCEKPQIAVSWPGRRCRIYSGSGFEQKNITITDQRSFSRQSKNTDLIAVETTDAVAISVADAQSGLWYLEPDTSEVSS